MQSNLRPVETPPPAYTDAPTGYDRLNPVLRALLAAAEQRWSGSIAVRDANAKLLAVLRCQAGQVVAARSDGARGVVEAVLPLCTRDGLEISAARGMDLVGGGPEVRVGRVDPCSLLTAAARDPQLAAAITEAVEFLGPRSVTARQRLELARYAWTAEERAIVECVASGPRSVLELELHSTLPHAIVARVMFALWVTRAVTLAPAWVRTISRPPPARDDEPTVVAPTDWRRSEIRPTERGRYHERSPEHGVSVLCESEQTRADRHFEVAELLLERGRPREAVFEAQKALRLCHPRPEQEAFYAWALYQRGGAGPRVPQHVWERLNNALAADPQCARALRYRELLERIP